MAKSVQRETKEATLTVRLRPSAKALIERQAAEELRSMADHIEWLARQYEARKGKL